MIPVEALYLLSAVVMVTPAVLGIVAWLLVRVFRMTLDEFKELHRGLLGALVGLKGGHPSTAHHFLQSLTQRLPTPLTPSATDKPGGKQSPKEETGVQITHGG